MALSAAALLSALLGPVTSAAWADWTAPMNIESGSLAAVSCASPAFCFAVDQGGYALRFNGSSWTPRTQIDPNGYLRSVSCPLSSFCAAVGSAGDAVIFSGSTWSSPEPIDSGASVNGVSCTSASFCMAVDGLGQALTYNGSSWSSPLKVDSSGALLSVSCASPSFCAAVGDDYALTYDGSAWTSPVKVDNGQFLNSVSCPSSSFCTAVDDFGNAFEFDGSSWSSPVPFDSAEYLSSVSCPTSSFCAAVRGNGHAATFSGTTWSAPSAVDSISHLNSVSCPSSSFCIGVDDGGNALAFRAAEFSLTVARTGSGKGTVMSSPAGIDCGSICSAQFAPASLVSLTPSPVSGSMFAGWSGGGCSEPGATQPTAGGTGSHCQVTMDSNQTVTADFVSTAKLDQIKKGLASALARLKAATNNPPLIGKAVCTGHVSYGAKAAQAGEYQAAPVTVADFVTKARSSRAPRAGAGRVIVVFVGAKHLFHRAGRATITQRMTARGRRSLIQAGRHHRTLKLHVLLSFTFGDPTKVDTAGTILIKPSLSPRC